MNKYIFMWGTAPVLPSFWACPQMLKERKDLSFPGKKVFQYFDGESISAYMLPSELEEIKQGDSKKLLNKEFYETYIEGYEKESKNWWAWIKEVEEKDYANISREELIEDHQKFTEYQRDAIGYFGTTRPEPLFAVEQRLIEILKKHREDEWPNIFGILTDSVELDDVQKEQLDFVKLASNDLSDESLKIHSSKYPWLVFGQFEEDKVLSFLKDLIKEIEEIDHVEKLKKSTEEKENLKKKQQEIFSQLKEDKQEVTYLSRILQEQSVRRMDIKSFWIGSYYLARNFWKALAKELNLEIWDFLKFVSPQEIQELLKETHERDVQEIIKERTKSYAINYEGEGEIEMIAGEAADKMFREKVEQKERNEKEIRGRAASLGTYRGRARKVMPGNLDMLKEDIKNFQKGEILVTTMTQPNMMVIARKAGAIVADEGGITSHAAIIARELKIPCIVGCLHSMQTINNGDLIEVDANNETVKILEKNNKELNFQKMWEAHSMGAMSGEIVIAFNHTNDEKLKEKVGGIERNAIFLYKKGRGTQFYYDKDEMEQAAQYGFDNYKNKTHTNKWIKEAGETIELSNKTYRNFIKLDLKKESPKELFKRFKDLLAILQKPYSYFYACQPQYFRKLEEHILEKLRTDLDEEITEKIYSTLTLPNELDPLGIEELEWLKVMEHVKKEHPNRTEISKEDLSEKLHKKIKEHSETYLYLGTVEVEVPWDFDHYMKLLNQNLGKDIKEQIKKIELKKLKLIQEKQELIERHNIDKEIIEICTNLANISLTRLALRFAWTEVIYSYIEVLREIGRRNIHPLIDASTIFEIRVTELKELILNNNLSVSEQEIKRRQNAYLLYSKNLFHPNNELEFYSGEEAIEKKKQLTSEEKQTIKEFNGVTACKGKVTGKVRLFSWVEKDLTTKMDEMEKGEILVAGQTRPFLMPAIRKAGAIITDEGGITSHASIISRELNIPCIMSTRIATKILKDDDLVEVDANNGTVKILNE